MQFTQKRLGFFVLFVSLTISLAGCEYIEKAKGVFFKDKKKSPTKAQPAAKKAPKPMAADVLARVGKWKITKSEFEDRLNALKEVIPEYDTNNLEARKLVLDELVRQQLIVEDAVRTGLVKDKDIVAAVEEFRRTLIVRETARRLAENITVSDEELRAFYDEKKDLLIEEAEWRVRQIVVDSELEVKAVVDQIDKGSDFANVAKMYSKADNADTGGDLGFITDVPFPEMAGNLLALKEGDISQPFQGPDGLYIIKLEEKRGGKQIPFENIKEEIRQNRLLFKQQEMILEHINKLQQEISVEVNEGNLQ